MLNPKALGSTLAILAGAFWLVAMSVSLLTGLWQDTVATVSGFHPYVTYTWTGMVLIVVEHLVAGYILGWVFAWLYNKLSRSVI
ncbi:MAG: hypothetical protein UY99_C0010G0045 [Parcubacteria group bacterium GW2011_GWA1_59_11]|nr:MAG: hypothetical protein UY99_C0010G0045 [Parcubacteria group bacterium GW2011_GWA1_59_11]